MTGGPVDAHDPPPRQARMKAAKNLLTTSQVAIFTERMAFWQQVLGLNDWRIERSRRVSTSMAEVLINPGARLATYRTGNFGATEINFASIDSTACHEVIHILLAEFKHMLTATDDTILVEAAEHRVVNTLEKLLMAWAKTDIAYLETRP